MASHVAISTRIESHNRKHDTSARVEQTWRGVAYLLGVPSGAPERTRAHHRLSASRGAHAPSSSSLRLLGLLHRLLLLRRRRLAPGVAPAHVSIVLPAAAGCLGHPRGRARANVLSARSAQELVRGKLLLQLVQLHPQRVVVARHRPPRTKKPAAPHKPVPAAPARG